MLKHVKKFCLQVKVG